jgi:hypothetical protein
MDRIGQWLWYANLFVTILFLARSLVTRAHQAQRMLFTYFAASTAIGVLLLKIPYSSILYARTYLAMTALLDLLAFLTVLELYRNALAQHTGLAKFGRAAVWGVTLVVLVVTGAGAALDPNIPPGQSPILHRWFTVERSADMVILLFLLIIGVFVTWFPVKMSRNVALSFRFFSAILFFTRCCCWR